MRIIQLITLLFSFFLSNGALAQGTKISIYKDQNEAVQLVVYPSQVMCKKNFAVDISFPKGLHNSNEWLVWTLNYKDCNKNVRQIQMSTPIGKECSRVSEFLSIIQSGASSQIIGEHTTIEPRCEFSDIDLIIDVTDVRFVRSYQAPNSAQSSVQAPRVSSSSSVEDGQMILTSMSFRIPTFSGPDWKT